MLKVQKSSKHLVNMQLIAILFLFFICFIVGSDGKCRAACRRRRRAHADALQVANVQNILKTDKLSLFSKDYYFNSDHLYKVQMCPFINERIAINGSWPKEPLSLQAKEEFSQKYFDRVYNAANFPLTYRNSGVYFDTNDTQFEVEMRVYYNRYCEKNYDGTFSFIFVTTIFIIIIIMMCEKPNRR